MYWDTPSKETIEFFKEHAKYDAHYFEVEKPKCEIINLNEWKEERGIE